MTETEKTELITRQQLIERCLTCPGSYPDAPFEDPNWSIMRCRNRKWFAAIFERDGKVYINLKCEPMRADLYRRSFAQITPGYHMNKTHWNTVICDGSLPDALIEEMIDHSFSLVNGKQGKK